MVEMDDGLEKFLRAGTSNTQVVLNRRELAHG